MSKRKAETERSPPTKRAHHEMSSSQPLSGEASDNKLSLYSYVYKALNKVFKSSDRPPNVCTKKSLIANSKPSLFNVPPEVTHLILRNLTLEDAFNVAKTCKTAHKLVNSFLLTIKYDWVNNMFKKLETLEEKVTNVKYLYVVMKTTAKKTKQKTIDKLFEWLSKASLKCPNVPVQMLFELLFQNWGEERASELIGRLIKSWMGEDTFTYIEAFPLGPDSLQEHVDAEKRLMTRFKCVLSANLQLRTKAYLFSMVLRTLAEPGDFYKLIYLFCAPRQNGFIDFEYFTHTHPNEEGVQFGNMANAIKLIMSASKLCVGCAFTDREMFVLLEDLTTAPVVWSMHSFVKFLLTNVELCILSTFVRFVEGYHEDAASTFYYCVRANADSAFLNTVVVGIMRNMAKDLSVGFVRHVKNKCYNAIFTCDPNNPERLRMLRITSQRANAALVVGLTKFKIPYVHRSSSI